MPITFGDTDIAEINMGVAEQALIKASVECGDNQIKALLVAKQSINNALTSLGFNGDVEIKSGLSKEDKSNHYKEQSAKRN